MKNENPIPIDWPLGNTNKIIAWTASFLMLLLVLYEMTEAFSAAGTAAFHFQNSVWGAAILTALFFTRRYELLLKEKETLENTFHKSIADIEFAINDRAEREILRLREDGRALERKGALYRQVIDAAPIVLFAKDWEGKFLIANKKIADIYGTTPVDMEGKPESYFNTDKEQVDRIVMEDNTVLTTGRPQFLGKTYIQVGKAGKLRWFQTVKLPFMDPQGNCRGVLGVALEIE